MKCTDKLHGRANTQAAGSAKSWIRAVGFGGRSPKTSALLVKALAKLGSRPCESIDIVWQMEDREDRANTRNQSAFDCLGDVAGSDAGSDGSQDTRLIGFSLWLVAGRFRLRLLIRSHRVPML